MDSYKPDPIDLQILNLLQKDGLMTNKEVAHHLNKSITPIVERIKKLRVNGYIQKVVAIVDVHKIRNLFIAFPHVQLTKHTDDVLKEFQQAMLKHPQVLECYHITGQYDFMVKVALPDMTTYADFIRTHIASLPYVGNIQSFLALSEIKRETAYEL